jgi:hypothetical protein
MSILGVNLWAVLAAGVAAMMVGFLWYSPLLFAKPWMALMGYDPTDKAKTEELQQGAGKLYAISFLASLVTAFVLGKVIHISTVNSALYGAKIGGALWLGFVATVQLTDGLFAKKPANLYLINTGYQLVSYLTMGAILGMWPPR